VHPIGIGGRDIDTAKIILPKAGRHHAKLQMAEACLSAVGGEARSGGKTDITFEIGVLRTV